MSSDPRPHEPLAVEIGGAVGSLELAASFSAAAGQATAIFGPSGSGKTTLLRAVSGLVRLRGRVAAGAQVWQNDDRGVFLPPHRRRVGFAFQQAVLFDHLSVAGNLRYAARRRNAATTSTGTTAGPSWSEVVETLDVAPHLDRAPGGLSGGERQRVSLARALLSGPSVLLLDEPLSGLHRPARSRILPWLRALAARSGMVVLYVSHDLGEVVEVAHHVAPIQHGSVNGAWPVAEALERLDAGDPLARFEASAILTARVRRHRPDRGLSELDLGGQPLRVPGSHVPEGETARLRVRARDVALATEAPRAISIRNVLRGAILEIREETEGPFAFVFVDVAGQRLGARITRDARAELRIEPGREVFALLKTVSFDGS